MYTRITIITVSIIVTIVTIVVVKNVATITVCVADIYLYIYDIFRSNDRETGATLQKEHSFEVTKTLSQVYVKYKWFYLFLFFSPLITSQYFGIILKDKWTSKIFNF